MCPAQDDFVALGNEIQNDRTVSMKVLVLGMPRTGTLSIRTALGLLGFQGIYHMHTVLQDHPEHAALWVRVLEAKYHNKRFVPLAEWDAMLGAYQAVTDLPCTAFAPELIAAYPDAKVILSLRNVDDWYDSVMCTIQRARTGIPRVIFSCLARLASDFAIKKKMFDGLMDGLFEDDFPRRGKLVFHEHAELVRQLMKERPKDFLEFDVKEGWTPLCSFLDCPQPATEFPRTNSGADFTRVMLGVVKGAISRQGQREWTFWLAGIAVGFALGIILAKAVL